MSRGFCHDKTPFLLGRGAGR